MDSNDLIRENILQYLYELNQDCRSPDGALAGIKKIQSELKKRKKYMGTVRDGPDRPFHMGSSC